MLVSDCEPQSKEKRERERSREINSKEPLMTPQVWLVCDCVNANANAEPSVCLLRVDFLGNRQKKQPLMRDDGTDEDDDDDDDEDVF